MPENDVKPEHACPCCGNRNVDSLLITLQGDRDPSGTVRSADHIYCKTCKAHYDVHPPVGQGAGA